MISKFDGKKIVLLLAATVLFKLACDVGYWKIVSLDTEKYLFRPSVYKYILGCVFLLAEFILIRHAERKASTFLIFLFYLAQMIPFTTIYALGNDSTLYYVAVSFGFILLEILMFFSFLHKVVFREKVIVIVIVLVFTALVLALTFYLYRMNGKPSLQALNIYRVYDLRASGQFQIGKYQSYLLTWTMGAILPFGIALAIDKKKYFHVVPCCAIMVLVYLYTGYKTYLFAIPLVIICTIWSKRKNGYIELFFAFCVGFVLLLFLACYSPIRKHFFENVYSLIGRRMMLVPANNKFKYYDYFSKNPSLGLYGLFPTWLVPIRSPYEGIDYSFVISKIYYYRPEMNSNTGFLAEGYMRFGFLGIPALFLLLAGIMKAIDRFQDRCSYELAVGLFVYPVFSLADGQLLSSMASGEWLVLIGILLFFNNSGILKGQINARQSKRLIERQS